MGNAGIRRGMTSGQNVLVIVLVAIVGLAISCFGAVFIAGLILPAIGQVRSAAIDSRTRAMEARSQAQLASFEAAYAAAIAHGIASDPSLDDLIEHNYIIVETTLSPFGPVSDGRGDFWFLADRTAAADSTDPSLYIVAYDRAMYETHSNVAVMVLDGRGRLLGIDDFHAMVADPVNADRDFDLPSRVVE